MKERTRGISGRIALLAIAAALFGTLFAANAGANNLDRNTATQAAKQVAKFDCNDTSGCKDYFVRDLHKVSRHKAQGKIHVISEKNGSRFDCVRQVVIKLDHFTGEITYALGARRCENLGPARS